MNFLFLFFAESCRFLTFVGGVMVTMQTVEVLLIARRCQLSFCPFHYGELVASEICVCLSKFDQTRLDD